MMEQARKKRATDIFKLKGKVYAFDSTTIPLCLSVFWWAKFRKKKGGIKAHVLYDLESQVPAFFHITSASVHDSKAMKGIPYESGSYYVFDRGYIVFKTGVVSTSQHSQCMQVRSTKVATAIHSALCSTQPTMQPTRLTSRPSSATLAMALTTAGHAYGGTLQTMSHQLQNNIFVRF